MPRRVKEPSFLTGVTGTKVHMYMHEHDCAHMWRSEETLILVIRISHYPQP